MVNKRNLTAATSTTLVIVESPSKCKKIESYLGPGYKCVASFGHLRELPSLDHIDFANNFKPTYTISDSKVKQVSLLKTEIALAGEVVLATDDDREGEAIAWHICMIFDLNPSQTKRIIFHEITETAIQHAIRNPTRINMNVVYAQQARQILDLLVGFKISPLLWKYISHQSLSAGRCQSPALKLIYDNQQEIECHPGRKIYNTSAFFQFAKAIPFDLNTHHETEEDMIEFLDECASFSHVFTCTQPSKIYKQPPAPLSTSRIQQVSSNEMHISPKETMKLCQTLYEAGYITYMRTDSQTYCAEFLNQVQKYIQTHYDDAHILKREGSTNPQKDAPETPHEAIRPTNISLIKLPDKFSSKEQRMYRLIWETTLESCMSPAEFYSIKATIQAPMKYHYTHTAEKLCFLGWMAVNNRPQAREEEERNYNVLSHHQNPNVKYAKILSKLAMKDTKQHYTEAKLVQLLEEQGIGRPSTFSMLVEKIQEREYVKKQNVPGKSVVCKDFEMEADEIFEIETTREFGNERGKLVIQPLGVIVIDFLEKHFAPLFDYNYTKQMEDGLDMIASDSKVVWQNICKECLEQIDGLITRLNTPAAATGANNNNNNYNHNHKVEYKIDDQHSYIIGKHGPVVKCMNPATNETTFKSVNDQLDVHKLERGEYALDEILSTPNPLPANDASLGQYEGHDLCLKKGKFGIYASWGTETHSLKCFGNRPIENISYADVVEVLEKSGNVVRKINDDLSIRTSKRGNYIFHKTTKMRKPQFLSLKECRLDYETCEISLLRQWIHDTYSI